MTVSERLREMGWTLPEVAVPVGAYVPAIRTGNYVFTSGQLPVAGGSLSYTGKVGRDISAEEGYQAARLCALNALAAAASAAGGADKIARVIKLTGFINSAADFTEQAKVLNGASDLLGKLFDSGHARSAVGVYALPLDAAVEVEMIAELTDM